MQSLILVPIVSLLAGRLALRSIRRIAIAVDFVDRPDRRRKLHGTPIPLGGGVAVWLAAWLGWGAGMLADGGPAPDDLRQFAGLGLASFATLALGIVDDRFGLRGGHKLAGQIVAAAILVGMGFRVGSIAAFGHPADLGALAIPATFFWIILVVNAFNLIDGMDGFCGGVGLITSLALALVSCWSGRAADAFAALALAGALAAFLKDNLPPARIYLGDAGSMTIGLMVAALSLRACSDGTGSGVSILPLAALVALPLLDVLTALGRRWLTGKSLFEPDRGHIHHRLRGRLGGPLPALGAAVGLATIGAVGAALSRASVLGDGASCVAIVASIGLLVGTSTFGDSELRLLLLRLRLPVARFLRRRSAPGGVVRHECHILGSRDWSRVWEALVQDVEAADLRRVELAIEMPAAGETYHGLWSISKQSDGRSDWSMVHAIQVDGHQAGTLSIAGIVDETRDRYLDAIGGLVRSLEARIEEELARAFVGRPEEEASPVVHPDATAQSRYGPSLA